MLRIEHQTTPVIFNAVIACLNKDWDDHEPFVDEQSDQMPIVLRPRGTSNANPPLTERARTVSLKNLFQKSTTKEANEPRTGSLRHVKESNFQVTECTTSLSPLDNKKATGRDNLSESLNKLSELMTSSSTPLDDIETLQKTFKVLIKFQNALSTSTNASKKIEAMKIFAILELWRKQRYQGSFRNFIERICPPSINPQEITFLQKQADKANIATDRLSTKLGNEFIFKIEESLTTQNKMETGPQTTYTDEAANNILINAKMYGDSDISEVCIYLSHSIPYESDDNKGLERAIKFLKILMSLQSKNSNGRRKKNDSIHQLKIVCKGFITNNLRVFSQDLSLFKALICNLNKKVCIKKIDLGRYQHMPEPTPGNITKEHIDALAGLISLQNLILSGHEYLTDGDLVSLKKTKLNKLNLDRCKQITSLVVGNLPLTLNILVLSSTAVTEKNLFALCGMPALKTLNLKKCKVKPDNNLRALSKKTKIETDANIFL